jgi:outer membrane protein assembly factor BamA
LANWKQIQASVGAAESILKHDGYLGPASQIARSYHDETHVVDLGVKVNKGQQSLFGAVTFKGLSPADEQQARKAWALKEGAPFNPFYISEYNNGYLRSVAQTLRFKSVSQQIRPRAGSNVVDVTIVIGF